MSSSQPIPLIYSGQAGSYFGTEYERLPADVHPSIYEVGQKLSDRGLNYLGKLTCSQFSHIEVYAYATPDERIAVSVMGGELGLQGIDFVCKFADESFLTTTTVRVTHNAYEEQKLFRVSLPGSSVEEVLIQHLAYIEDFEKCYGQVQAIFPNLVAIAKMVDEYTIRQQSNQGHGFLELANGFTIAGMQQIMGENEDEEEHDEEYDEDEYDLDRIEYDEAQVSPLIRAILQENIGEVERLLADGAKVNPSNWQEEAPLVAAVHKGNLEIIQKLITAGANLDRLDFSVDSRPIGVAIKQNQPDLVKFLLDAGASPEGGDLSWTGLTIAIRQNNLPILRMLLDAGADPNTGMGDDDRAIIHAAGSGNLEMLKLLVERGADVSAWSQGETAIMTAASNADRAIYEHLYPLVDAETRRYADKHGQQEIQKAIKRKAREGNKLGEKLGDAALFGKTAKVQQLLREGADPNVITECGKTPLMLAAMYGHKSTLEVLLDAGADPNLLGEEEFEEGTTALMYIASSFFAGNRAEVIKFLVARGANPDLQNHKGQTALILAGENIDAAKALIEAGANTELRDNEGNTAMMLGSWAVQQLLCKAGASSEGLNDVALVETTRQGDLTKLEELLQAGANVNYSDGSALVAAAGKGHLEVVDRLIQAGADVNLGWRTGFTPIAEAAYAGYLSVVERLLSAGANPFQRTHDEDGDDALDYSKLGQAQGHHPDRDYAAIIELLSQLPR